MAFTCPVCSRTSQSPDDAREGYCGACRDWTGVQVVSDPLAFADGIVLTDPGGWWQFILSSPPRGILELAGSCGVTVDAVARYIAERYGRPVRLPEIAGPRPEVSGPPDPNTLSTLITSRSQPGEVIAGLAAGGQPEVDGYSWNDAAVWSPGYGEL